jgi:hypothetical protein
VEDQLAANFIHDSSTPLPEGVTALAVSAPPCKEWQAGRFTFRRARRQGRWTCQVSGRGAAGYRTPFGAFLTVKRMLRQA